MTAIWREGQEPQLQVGQWLMVVTSFYKKKKTGCYVCTSVYVWHTSSLLKMEPTGFCSISVHVCQTVWHCTLEETNLDASL